MRKSVNEVMQIASRELRKKEKQWNCGLSFYVLIDAADFYTVGYKHKDPENNGLFGDQMHFDIDAKTGELLVPRPYLPWSEYGKKLDSGKRVEIPEEYKN